MLHAQGAPVASAACADKDEQGGGLLFTSLSYLKFPIHGPVRTLTFASYGRPHAIPTESFKHRLLGSPPVFCQLMLIGFDPPEVGHRFPFLVAYVVLSFLDSGEAEASHEELKAKQKKQRAKEKEKKEGPDGETN